MYSGLLRTCVYMVSALYLPFGHSRGCSSCLGCSPASKGLGVCVWDKVHEKRKKDNLTDRVMQRDCGRLSNNGFKIARGVRELHAPGQDYLLIRRKRGKFIKGAELYWRRVAEWLGPKVELALLVGHETGCCKEARPEKEETHRGNQNTTHTYCVNRTHSLVYKTHCFILTAGCTLTFAFSRKEDRPWTWFTYVAEENTCFSGGSWCPFR